MYRYYQDWERKRAHENQIEHKDYFTYEQLRDICALLREKKWPDASFSDAECNAWSLIRQEIDCGF